MNIIEKIKKVLKPCLILFVHTWNLNWHIKFFYNIDFRLGWWSGQGLNMGMTRVKFSLKEIPKHWKIVLKSFLCGANTKSISTQLKEDWIAINSKNSEFSLRKSSTLFWYKKRIPCSMKHRNHSHKTVPHFNP